MYENKNGASSFSPDANLVKLIAELIYRIIKIFWEVLENSGNPEGRLFFPFLKMIIIAVLNCPGCTKSG